MANAETHDESSVAGPGTCHDCGHLNPEEARFCEDCGASLFEGCPKCNEDSRTRVRHCVACGVDKHLFRRAESAIETTKEHLTHHRYDAALTEANEGLKCGYFEEKLRHYRDQAEGLRIQLQSLNEEAHDLLIEGDLERSLQRVEAALKLSPDDDKLKTKRTELTDRIRDRDAATAIENAKHALENSNRFYIALEACNEALQLRPKNVDAMKLRDQANALRVKHETGLAESQAHLQNAEIGPALTILHSLREEFPWDGNFTKSIEVWEERRGKINELLPKAREALKEKKFPQAMRVLAKIIHLVPGNAEFEKLLDEARKLETDRDNWLRHANELIEKHEYEKGVEALEALTAEFPWDDQIKSKLDECRDVADLLPGRRTRAREQEEKRNWKEAVRAWEQVERIVPQDREAAEGLERSRHGVARQIQIRTAMGIVFIVIGVCAYAATMNWYHLKQARAALADADLGMAQDHVDRTGWFIAIGKEQVVTDLNTAVARVQAINAKARAEKAAQSMPADDEQIMSLLSAAAVVAMTTDAQKSFDQGDFQTAKNNWSQAAINYRDLKTKSDELIAARAQALQAKQQADSKRNAALQSAKQSDPAALWTPATDAMSSAQTGFDKGEFTSAHDAWVKAVKLWDAQKSVIDLRSQAEVARRKAVSQNAQQRSKQLWEQAERWLQKANANFTATKFGEAAQAWRVARDTYQSIK